MKRTHLAVLTILLAGGLVGIVIKRAYAQTGSPSQWSTVYTSGPLSGCPPPAAGTIIECAVTNVGKEESVNGSAYVPVNQPGIQGAQGLVGATGPVGPQGIQGIPGPVQSFGTNKCSNWSGGNSGVTESGCVQSTP